MDRLSCLDAGWLISDLDQPKSLGRADGIPGETVQKVDVVRFGIAQILPTHSTTEII